LVRNAVQILPDGGKLKYTPMRMRITLLCQLMIMAGHTGWYERVGVPTVFLPAEGWNRFRIVYGSACNYRGPRRKDLV